MAPSMVLKEESARFASLTNPSADIASKAWLDLGRYAREVLAAQDTHRFVLGFTICGSLMRVWEFGRLGGIASEQFDIKKDGLQCVSTILGFLSITEEQLRFNPTIITSGGERYIDIERLGKTERLIIDESMKRAPYIAGRATTCWKVYCEDDPYTPLVIKDSWQYAERDDEGEWLQEVTDNGVVNVARYYHHETVRVGGTNDDVRSNVRKGLDVTKAANCRPERSMLPPSTNTASTPRQGRSSSAGVKRSSSQTDAPLPSGKRSCSVSPTKTSNDALPNRVRRRVVLRDYGKPIYCVEGHKSLLKQAGLLHRDISINNLIINEDNSNPS